MSSTTINLKVIDQTLTMIGTPVVASGGINEDYLLIDFDSSWDNLAKIAIFYKQKGEIYYSLVDTENKCIVPQEVITTKGFMYLGICGVYDDLQKTTQVIKYQITNGSLDSIEIEEPTPNIYMQIMSELSNIRATAQQLSANEQAFEESIQSQFDEYKLEVPTIAENTATQIVNNLMGECNTSIANLNNATRINLLRPTLQTQTVNGVTITNNGNDGTYTLNGTSTGTSYITFGTVHLNKGIYKLLGSFINDLTKDCSLYIKIGSKAIYDKGNGINFEVTSDGNYLVQYQMLTNKVFDNIVIKPMITTNLNATYDDFVSFEDSLATNKLISTRVNLLKPTLQTITKNGVTCTNNGNGTYTLNGTATSNVDFLIFDKTVSFKNVKIVGCPKGGSKTTYRLFMFWDNSLANNAIDYGDGSSDVSIDNKNLKVNISAFNGVTYNNVVFKPMITTNLNATYDDFISCLGTSWTQDTTNGYYTQSIICSGITSNDNPTIDVVLSGTLAEMQAQQEDWGKTLKVETSTDKLKFYASEPTTVSLSVMVKGV